MNEKHEEQLYKEAKKRVKLKTNFKVHRNVYIFCMIFLAIINLWTSPRYLWFKWPALAWGFGLAMHWLNVMHKLRVHSSFESEIEKEMNILKDRVDGDPISMDINKNKTKIKVKK